MFAEDVLEDCLMELQPYGSFPMRSFRGVNDTQQPVRKIEALTSVYTGGLMDGPVGGIYAATFLDSSIREVFIWGSPNDRDHETAVFLKPGRKTDNFDEIRDLMINDPKDAVPHSLIESLRRYDEARDIKEAAELRVG